MDIEKGWQNSSPMKIWYFRHRVGHGRTWNRHRAIAKIFRDDKFWLFYPEDIPDLVKQGGRVDLAIVAGKPTAEALRARGLDLKKRAGFRVYLPTWKRNARDCTLQMREIKQGGYHLVIPDQVMFLDKYRQVHDKVYYIDRGFDPSIFYPGTEEERTRGIVFCGNYRAYGREARLERLRDAHPGLAEWRRLKYRKMPAYLRSAKIGWNQIMHGPPSDKRYINYRVWEVIGSRTALLCSYSKDIPLTPGVHYIAWDSDTDLMRKAKLLLERDEHRKQIAETGYREALAKHTWRHRAMQYKEIIESHM